MQECLLSQIWFLLPSRLPICIKISSKKALDNQIGMQCLPLLEFLGGITSNHRHRFDITNHNATSSNDGTLSNMPARGKEGNFTRYPYIVLDRNSIILLLEGRRIDMMRSGENLGPGANYDMIADTDRISQVKLVGLNTHMIAHGKISIGLPSQT